MSLPQATPLSLDSYYPLLVVNPAAYATAKSSPSISSAPVVLSPPSSLFPQSITTSTSFQGLTATNCQCTPPDVQVGVGPSHVVEEVNVDRKIWDKTGSPITTIALATFYGTADSMSDPKVLYDSVSGRWFSSMLDVSANSIFVAVSSTNDPTGTWTVYNFAQGSGFLPDQPILGVSSDKVVVSSNDFQGNTFKGAQYWVLNKSEMLSGLMSIHSATTMLTTSEASVHPVRALSSVTTEYMVMSGSAVSCPSPSTALTLYSLTGVPPGAVTQSTTSLTMLSAACPANAPQPSPAPAAIDTSDGRVEDSVWNQNVLWITFDDSCVISSVTLACVRLIQVNTGTSTKTQDFDVGAAGLYYFHAALNVDGTGDLSLVFGYSNGSTDPSLAVSGQATTDSPNTVESSTTISSGTAVENGNQAGIGARYGDYFGAALDPSDSTKVWVAGEYENSGVSVTITGYGTTHWATFVQSMSTQPLSGVTTNDLSGTDSSTNAAVAGALSRLDIDGGGTGVFGMQAGDDTTRIGLLMKTVKISSGNGFTAAGMVANDQYEIDFSVGTVNFSLLFKASGISAGTLSTFYKSSSVPLWNVGDTLTVGAISTGGYYTGTNIGFKLVDATSGSDGSVGLLIAKSYLKTLLGSSGGTGAKLIDISASTFASGTGQPGSGGATANDRSPTSGFASYTLASGAIPELPGGILLLALPVLAIYLLIRRMRPAAVHGKHGATPPLTSLR